MEATADRIRSVVKSLLPERPHHLSLYPDRKYPVPPNYLHHQSPLQYSTFLSDADRGVLLTRPYFDICDEPEPSPATPLPTAGAKKKTKMSFMDYKKAKKASDSPIENGLPGKPDEKNHPSGAVKSDRDSMRKELGRPREGGSQREGKAQDVRVNGETERYKSSTSKPAQRDAPSPSESKKRPLEPEDSARPHKKARPSEDLSRRPPRPETPRSSTQDKPSSKDGRPGAARSTPTSRAAGGSSKERDHAASPKVTANGAKNSNSSHSTSLPRRPDTSGKHLVPPLLSPLRHPAIDDELETNSPKKRPKESPSGGKAPSKAPKSEVTAKKKPVVPELPSLLSPTLPPLVEDELLRFEKTLSKGDLSQAGSQSSETSKSARREKTREDEVKPKSLVVTLRIRKALRPTVRRLLALPSKNRKDRSASVENTPPPAKKRPRPAEANTEVAPTMATKRPKAPDVPAGKAPYTPPNPPATLSQNPSGSLQHPTPGGRVAQTPGGGETVPHRSGSSKDREALMRRHGAMSNLGRTLKRERDKEKHERDRERQKQPNGAAANGERMAAEDYRAAMLTMEMILAYFIAFRSLNQACELNRTHVDEKAWLSLEAHLRELRHMTSHSLPLHTLAIQLNGILINEILRVYAINGNSSKLDEASQKILLRNVSGQFAVWSDADRFRSKLTDERLKTPVMGPWTSPYKAAADTLAVMARVADREHVHWKAEVVPPRD